MAFNMTIGVMSHKGGVGKTTLTRELGGILSSRGERVSMIEVDSNEPQKNWYQRAQFEGAEPPITVLDHLNGNSEGVLIVDTKGGVDDDVKQNMTICDALFVPVKGNVNDLDATAETVEFLKIFNKPFCTVIGMVTDKEQAKKAFSDLLRMKANPLPTTIGLHSCLDEYHSQGKLASQFKNIDQRANTVISEIEPLADKLIELAGGR